MAQHSASREVRSAKSLSDKIADIIADHLKSGERFPTESQLIRDLGVSRSALREVLSGYEAKGIITAQRGSGRFVRMPDLSASLVETWSFVLKADPNLMLDFLEIRSILELNSLSKAMERCTVDQLAQMSRLVESMKQLTEDTQAFARIDCEFHKAMFLTIGNRLLEQLLIAFSDLFRLYHLDEGGYDYKQIAQQHQDILEAFAKQDLASLTELMKEHFADLRYRIAVLHQWDRPKDQQ